MVSLTLESPNVLIYKIKIKHFKNFVNLDNDDDDIPRRNALDLSQCNLVNLNGTENICSHEKLSNTKNESCQITRRFLGA